MISSSFGSVECARSYISPDVRIVMRFALFLEAIGWKVGVSSHSTTDDPLVIFLIIILFSLAFSSREEAIPAPPTSQLRDSRFSSMHSRTQPAS